ncbi:MAG: hypothetical protein [Caudoviricetes sp.]|nr:MAG: hypothetical protein [Caudoviricetes sp.]
MKIENRKIYSYKIISKYLQENFHGTGFYEELMNEYKKENNKKIKGVFDKAVKLSKFNISAPIIIFNDSSIDLIFEKHNKKYQAIWVSLHDNNVYIKRVTNNDM